MIRRLLAAGGFLVLAAAMAVSPPAQANLDRERMERLVESLADASFAGFENFLNRVRAEFVGDVDTEAVIDGYLQGTTLTEGQSVTLYRLLGLYARLQYADEAEATLRRLVAIPTFRQEGLPQHENPAFIRFAEVLAAIASDFELQFRNVDNRVYEVTLPGASPELLGFHAHADVVPVNPQLWVLEDGTRLDPFQVTLVGDRMYGRGTEDDKNGIVVSLYAMRVIKEENLALSRTLRLLVDTTEETVGDAIPYYFERNAIPQYNIALDGGYPVVIAEKGPGTVMAHFPVRESSGEGAVVLSVSGGLATNQIPSASVARLQSGQPDELVTLLNEAAIRYVSGHGSNFRMAASSDGSAVTLIVEGVSAHSSEPQTGVNPVARMLDFLNLQRQRGLLQSNHITDAARYAAENWGLDYLAGKLGIGYRDDFMGPLTAALTFIALDDTQLRLAVNLRLPVGREPADLLEEIESRLDSWVASRGVEVEFELSAREPMYRNPEGAWVNALLDIATETLAMPREFGSSAGATSIHSLPNGVQFGLAMPDQKYSGHNANEFKTRQQFLLDLQIVTEAMARLGSMKDL